MLDLVQIYLLSSYCFRFLLGLQTDGALSIICSSTLLSKKVWDGPASDMVIVEDEADAETQILILLKAQEDSSTTFLQLVSFPGNYQRYEAK